VLYVISEVNLADYIPILAFEFHGMMGIQVVQREKIGCELVPKVEFSAG